MIHLWYTIPKDTAFTAATDTLEPALLKGCGMPADFADGKYAGKSGVDFMKTAVISAMESEILAVKEILEDCHADYVPGMKIYKGSICGQEAVLAVSGEGKVNAAACAQTLILDCRPDRMINVGIAGGIAPDMRTGDIIIADKAVQYDFDVSALGYERGYICSLNEIYIPCDTELADILYRVSAAFAKESSVFRGTVATGDMFVSSDEKSMELSAVFGACAADMETAAIAQVCRIANVPFGAVRAVSDRGGTGAFSDYRKFETYAADISAKIIGLYFSEIAGVK